MKSTKHHLLFSLMLLLSFVLVGCIPSSVETTKINPANVIDDGNGSIATKAPAFSYGVSSANIIQYTPFAIAPSITYAGAGLTFSLIGTLPTGLTLNTSNGMISGIPTSSPPNSNYIILATNNFGSSFKALSLDAGPIFSYPFSNYDYVVGIAFSAIVPTVTYPTSGVITYSVSPFLPAGLSLNPVTGEISGTLTANSASTSFLVTATSNGLSTSISMGLFEAGPPTVSYSLNYNYIRNTAFSASPTITYQGSNFTISSPSGTIPTGLSLNTSNGVISGSASIGGSGNQTFVVRVQNDYGFADHTINFIEVGAPVFTSTTFSASFQRASAFSLDLEATLTFPSAANVTYSSSPALPNANCTLSLDSNTGDISGTIAWNAGSSASDCARSYTVTATNNADPIPRTTALTVTISQTGVPQVGYPATNVTYQNNVALSVTPNYYYLGTLATPTAYAITSGALPSGVSLNGTTGVISGIPTSSVSATGAAHGVNITVTNSFGSNTFSLTLEEFGAPRISYSSTSYTFYRNGPATSFQTPTVSFCKGGCTFSTPDTLPTNVALNSTTGEISSTGITSPINNPSYTPVTFSVVYADSVLPVPNSATIAGFSLTEGCNPAASFFGQEFGGGGSTAMDPWFLCTEAHLDHMSTNPAFMDDDYRLSDDIDMATIPTLPIGEAIGACFSGSFEGNDKIISNFKVYDAISNPGTASYVMYPAGFFSCLSDFDFIQNLSLVNSYMYGEVYSGTITGKAEVPHPKMRTNLIDRVHVYRSVVRDRSGLILPDQTYAGGLIGHVKCNDQLSQFKLQRSLFHGTIHQDSPANGSIFGGLFTSNPQTVDCTTSVDNAVIYQNLISSFPPYNLSNPNSFLDYANAEDPFSATFASVGNTIVVDLNAILSPPPAPVQPTNLGNSYNYDDPQIWTASIWDSFQFPVTSAEYLFPNPSSRIIPIVPRHFCLRNPGHLIFSSVNLNAWQTGGAALICP
jgi:hypothetical protein